MAYPSTPITFTTRSAGQTISASHVNDLQTEVAAIEQGLLVGMAHTLIPDGDQTRTLGSSAARWVFHGSQVSSNTLPVAALVSSAAASSATYYRGDGLWAVPTFGSTLTNLDVSSNSTLAGAVNLGPTTAASLAVSSNLSASSATLAALQVTSSIVTVNAAENFIRWGGADPSTGSGLAGSKGSVYFSTATGEGYVKQTTTSTGWKLFTTA